MILQIIKLFLLLAVCAWFASCSIFDPNYCPPATEKNINKWEQRHKYGKRTGRYTSKARVMWINQTGPFYKVRFENMKERFNVVYKDSLPGTVIIGKWIVPPPGIESVLFNHNSTIKNMAKIKTKVYVNVTLEEAQEASEILATKQNHLDKLEAQMNEKINKIKSDYTDRITELNDALKEPTAILQAFANEQKPNWGKKKSFDLLHCVIGFRTGTPKVTKKKSFTWEAVLQLLQKQAVFKPFIRSTEEINKEAILAEKDDALLKKLKDDCFIEIDQDETFFATPKKEAVAAA